MRLQNYPHYGIMHTLYHMTLLFSESFRQQLSRIRNEIGKIIDAKFKKSTHQITAHLYICCQILEGFRISISFDT